TVYEAELVSMLLAAHLLKRELARRQGRAFLGVDSQAAIRATKGCSPTPGHYLVDAVTEAFEDLQDRGHHVRVRWTPGHVGIDGNERADELAKAAAEG
ncbi:hypothetical protein CONPUDRAFT_29773, partial [Coniophora puteana RWD-64-598 SS2]